MDQINEEVREATFDLYKEGGYLEEVARNLVCWRRREGGEEEGEGIPDQQGGDGER
jgi:hypothetical protein